jgi:hypothetical protein
VRAKRLVATRDRADFVDEGCISCRRVEEVHVVWKMTVEGSEPTQKRRTKRSDVLRDARLRTTASAE